MKLKEIKHNHTLTDLLKVFIFALIMLAPIGMIGTKCLYVICNKNAYKSYSDEYVEKYSQVNNSSTFIVGQEYLVAYDENSTNTSGGLINVSDTNLYDYFAPDINNRVITGINFVVETYARINLVFSDTTTLRINNWNETTTSFVFTYESTNITGNVNIKYTNIYGIVWTTEKLDNVFEYSVSRLVDENNFGKLNFFTWFANMLLDDAQMNMTYVRFANWYLCYAMLISLMQILFLCLMWFVNFSRRLLERGMNYDW